MLLPMASRWKLFSYFPQELLLTVYTHTHTPKEAIFPLNIMAFLEENMTNWSHDQKS